KTPDGATNNIHCLVRYAASGVRAARWQTDAVDATNENPLTPIPAGGASESDAVTNFIVGGEDGLGFVVEPGGVIERVHSQAPVRLNILDDSDDDKSGFGYARVRLAGAGLNVERTKFYVGLLSGTNVGAPISDNSLTGVWRANLTYLEESRVFTSTFILDVNFGPNTLKTRANSRPSVISDGSRTLAIDGKFTETGVLYGTTNLYTGSIPIGLGTLSGVIGVDGAVGIFASDASSGGNVYVGGFVAALGCTDNPFNVGCTSDADFDARVLKCRGDIDANGAGGCDATARVICMDGRTGPNPITANLFDPLCSRIPEFVDNIITTCNNAPNNEGVFAVCPERIASLCPNSGARNPGCPPLAVTEGKVDFVRWARTATDATNTNKLTILPAITGRSDPDFSYVEGRRDGLELGDYFTEEETAAGDRIGTGIFNNHNQTLRLSDLAGGLDNTTSGAAFRQFTIQNGNRN
ncbi:MAG: hypothetical protein K8953_13200, partial [Proteobacteria bacterium]|nr:hypothetical protein [Pseudomonadota bacterium]